MTEQSNSLWIAVLLGSEKLNEISISRSKKKEQ